MTETTIKALQVQLNNLARNIEYNNKITEGLVQQVSGIGSDLKDFKMGDSKWKENVDLFISEMSPVKSGLHTVQSMNTFIKWLGFPAIGSVLTYWLLK